LEPSTTELPNGFLFEGRYEIVGELGAGSFGRVTGQSVAIKLLERLEATASSSGRAAERFRRETQICAGLSHPNIVRLIDAGETDTGRLYAVFEHVPGDTLATTLEREGALDVGEALRLMAQVLEALAAAHAQGIVHRDLKPANLMLSDAGVRRSALILDFGLGGVADGWKRKEWQTLTQTREFLGTPLYAAPEQLRGEPATPRSDLYAWGLILLECLTGRHPFSEQGPAERLLTGGGTVEIPEWLHGHPLGELLAAVTACNPETRDVSVEMLIGTLDQVSRGELPVAPETLASRRPPPLSQRGERRHLTVMFCDLVDSSGLAQRLDAESYRDVIRAYQARAAEAVERYGGHVAQYLGDGLLVYFGHPTAHEDDAERGVRAGRAILRGLAALTPRVEAEHGVAIAARVGIHTGPVVVSDLGSGARKETLALGDTPNIAARLEALAEPDTLVISEATRSLVAGLFVTQDLGTPALKGISEPIRVHRVVEPSGVTSRLDRAPALTPFVGREQELALLEARFEQAREGQGQAVLVSGEPGIGKSRLLHELRGRLHATPHRWLECRTSPYSQRSAFQPMIELLEQALGLEERQVAEERIDRLERGLGAAGLKTEEAVPLLAGLLSLRLPEGYAPLQISPQFQRQKTLETLLAWVLALGDEQLLVLVVEDLHWADPSTLEWLGLVIEQCATARVLLLLSFRSEFEAPWRTREHLLPLPLGRLRGREARHLGRAAAAGPQLPEALLQALLARGDGVPLFIEELAKVAASSGSDPKGSLSRFVIPETLHDLLMARLDGLGGAKQLAQICAALGREFPYELLERVAPMKEALLREGLGQLVEAQLLHQRGLPPNATYIFRHALIQDTAYQSLLVSQRQEIHARIADALEAHFGDQVAREPARMARHCEEAARTEQAVAFYDRAGRQAARHWAHPEAIDHFGKAIDLLGTLPESRERDQQELRLQLVLGSALAPSRGYTDPELERVWERALALCQTVGDTPLRLEALYGLRSFHHMRGELRVACEIGETALALARQIGDDAALMTAHTGLGISLANQGQLVRSLGELEEAIRLDARQEPGARNLSFGIHARSYAARTLFLLGHHDRARQLLRETIHLAGQADPPNLALLLAFAASLYYRMHEPYRTRECADAAIAIARERGFPFALALASTYRGWAVGGEEGLREIEEGLAQFVALGAAASRPHGLLAEAYHEQGRAEDALAELDAALDSGSEARTYQAELHRARGEILLERGSVEEAGAYFRDALDVARQQSARTLELRAATSLARLLRDQGRHEEARALLRPIHDWFTEGFDTTDLQDAKALLEELA
jgi:TOMM system kinase/cyclase fusion protein